MLVTFEFRRHSIKDGPVRGTSGPGGYRFARAVGKSQLRGRGFTHFYASKLWRTHQAMAGYDEGAGDFALYHAPTQAPIYLEWPELFDLWRHCHKASKRGEDMLQAALAHDRALTERACAEITRMFRAWALTFPDGAHVLIVGHSPSMELIPLGLSGITIPSLKECQGFRIAFDGSTYAVDWQSPHLDPAEIRRELFADPSA